MMAEPALPDAAEWEGWPAGVLLMSEHTEPLAERIALQGWDWCHGDDPAGGGVWGIRALSRQLGVMFEATELTRMARGSLARVYVGGCGSPQSSRAWNRHWSWARLVIDDPAERWKLALAAWRQIPPHYGADYPVEEVGRDLDRFCEALEGLWAERGRPEAARAEILRLRQQLGITDTSDLPEHLTPADEQVLLRHLRERAGTA